MQCCIGFYTETVKSYSDYQDQCDKGRTEESVLYSTTEL
jgi:hypothetical protein